MEKIGDSLSNYTETCSQSNENEDKKKEKKKKKEDEDENGLCPVSPVDEKVRVIVRCRPFNEKEEEMRFERVVQVCPETNSIELCEKSSSCTNLSNLTYTDSTSQMTFTTTTSTSSTTTPLNKLGGDHSSSSTNSISRKRAFTFDAVYDERKSQKDLYNESFRPVVQSVLKGFNGTIFAYGQTGTGKTYTMEGVQEKEELHGVIPLAIKDIFETISNSPNKKYLVRASYLEIYQEEIRDLLRKDTKNNLKVCELRENLDGLLVKDLSYFLCKNYKQISSLMEKGNRNRATASTNMNEHSSRSHAVFTVTVEMSERTPDGQDHFRAGKLNLVDLAGSERQSKTMASGTRLKEAVKINLSLSALGNVIAALVDEKATHVPYRDSKLTRILQHSLGGNSKTCMVATIGPASYNWEETLTTLRYANRAKNIKNKPKINEDPKDALLRKYHREILQLREELEKFRKTGGKQWECGDISIGIGGSMEEEDDDDEDKKVRERPLISSGEMEQDARVQELYNLLEPFGLDPMRDSKEKILTVLETKKLEVERDASSKGSVGAEEERVLLERLEKTKSLIRSKEEEYSALEGRIKWMESKVIIGGSSMSEISTEQEKKIKMNEDYLVFLEKKKEENQKILDELEAQVRTKKELLEVGEERKKKEIKRLENDECFHHQTNDKRGGEESGERAGKEARNNKIEGYIGSYADEDENNGNENEEKVKVEVSSPSPSAYDDDDGDGNGGERGERVGDDNGDDSLEKLCSTSTNFPRPEITRSIPIPLYIRSTLSDIESVVAENTYFSDENILQTCPEKPFYNVKKFTKPNTNPFIKELINKVYEDAAKEISIDCSPKSRKKPGSRRGSYGRNRGCKKQTSSDTIIREIGVRKFINNSIDLRDISVIKFDEHEYFKTYGRVCSTKSRSVTTLADLMDKNWRFQD